MASSGSHQLVNIKYGERSLKLRLNMVTERNLSMIFKLDTNRGIYLTSEQEEIVLADDDGNFIIEDPTKCFNVNGETIISSPRSSGPLPLSYQRPLSNPPPGGSSRDRPTFTSKPKTSRSNQWKKSFTVVEVNPNGATTEKFQVHLSLQEDSANVPQLKEILKEQLGHEVEIVDSKYLPIMPGTMTEGSKFWKSSRKVMVVKSSEAHLINQKRNAKRSKNDVLDQIREFVESRDISQGTKQPVTSSRGDTEEKIKDIFKCTICLNTAQLPAAVCADCYHTIGCIACIEQWHESAAFPVVVCPLCRTNKPYNTIPIVRGIAQLLGQSIPAPEKKPKDNAESSTQNAGEEDDDGDDAFLFTSVFD